jgi:hypothetical protein
MPSLSLFPSLDEFDIILYTGMQLLFITIWILEDYGK